ncbi:uncharacterized protein A1O5_07554 [Cladophialophora psammophila CBS 110553]|uniref:Clr5 domain-containing protein n=1 Tax=Cladophialophora psammophila CBS 110553 TaxID=1182543 RepID=W9WNR5_9EURO|nr:uncharacterized protein A1O5_07554 [Cladophialophora psammophila CBS 110553]EXJ69518.1 hypothetical protein A1O5_07554 [Cladophialophora psammophila CBS 110553]
MTAPHKISNAAWQKHKQTICRLYVDQNMPMNRLIEEMSRDHGFSASKSQYMRQFEAWGIRKNQKRDFWKDISLTLKRRRLTIDEVDVFLKGELIPDKKLRRQLSRCDLPTLIQTVARPPTPDGIFIRPRIQIPRSLIISLPWHQICTQLEMAMSGLSRKTDRSPSPLPSAVLDVTDGMPGLGYGEDWQEIFLRCPFQTEVIQNYHPTLEFLEDRTIRKTSRDGDVVNATIASLLDITPGWTSQEVLANTMVWIAPYIPEQYPGETESVVNQLISPHSITRMQVLTSFMALMLANHLLDWEQVDAFVIGLNEMAGLNAFDMLPLREDPSTRAIVTELLFAAVRMDLLSLVKSAVKNRVDANRRSTGYNPKTLILEAVQRGRVRIVELLIDAGADITVRRMNGRNLHDEVCPLYEDSAECTTSESSQSPRFYCNAEFWWARNECAISAAAFSRTADEIVPLLLKSQVSTPVVLAGPVITQAICCGASKETVEMLLRHGASVDECCGFLPEYLTRLDPARRSTPLCAAICSRDVEMVRLLLDKGANPNGSLTRGHGGIMEAWTSYFYKSPLVVAVECAGLNMVKLLVEYGADPNWSALGILETAKRKQLIEESEFWRFDSIDEDCQILIAFPIQAAAGLDDPEMTKYLLSKGATANPVYGTPPLSIAACHGRDATVDLLIRRGAMINPAGVEESGLSPLEAAVCSGSEKLVQRMISAGADLDWCSMGRWGGTALQQAAERGFGAIFDLLQRAGAKLDCSSVPNHATMILQGFVKHHDYERTLRLLHDGVSPNAKCRDGSSPLTAAILSQDLALMSLLLEWGADANDACPMPALDEKLKFPYLVFDIDEMLATCSLPPLHWAVAVGNLDAVTCLCNARADLNKPDISKNQPWGTRSMTALHVAVALKRKDIVEYLLATGADVNSIMRRDIYCSSEPDDPQRLSPIIISVANSDLEITNMLLRNRADPYLGQLGNSELQAGRPQRGDLFALEAACYSGDIQMARLLISFRVDVYIGYPLVYTF